MGDHPRLRDGVLPVLEAEELVAVERVGEAGDVAGHEDVVGDEAVDVDGAAAGVGRHAERTGRQSRTLEPLDVADRAERDDDDVHVESVPSDSVAWRTLPSPLERADLDPRAEVDAVGALEVGGDLADHVAERTAKGVRARSTNVTSSPSWRQTDAISDPVKPPPMTSTRRGFSASSA